MNRLKKIIAHRYFFHAIAWVIIQLLTFVAIIRYDSSNSPFWSSLILIGSMIVPIYFHAYIFEKLFRQKKYYAYSIITVLIVVVFGYLNELLFDFLLEGVESETYLTLLIFMAVFTGFKYLKIGSRQQLLLEQEEKRRIKAENELLKSQVNPHFMFNTLNSIYSLILAKNDMAADSVLKLSGLLRYLLDNSKNKSVSLEQEYTFLNNYIDLEKIRLDGRGQIKFDLKGDIKGKKIAPMLLIPFVENAFKHGISSSPDKNHINIQLTMEQNNMSFKVENNIAPVRNTVQKKQDEIGIDNVSQRLNLLYPGKHELQIHRVNDTFSVHLQMVL